MEELFRYLLLRPAELVDESAPVVELGRKTEFQNAIADIPLDNKRRKKLKRLSRALTKGFDYRGRLSELFGGADGAPDGRTLVTFAQSAATLKKRDELRALITELFGKDGVDLRLIEAELNPLADSLIAQFILNDVATRRHSDLAQAYRALAILLANDPALATAPIELPGDVAAVLKGKREPAEPKKKKPDTRLTKLADAKKKAAALSGSIDELLALGIEGLDLSVLDVEDDPGSERSKWDSDAVPEKPAFSAKIGLRRKPVRLTHAASAGLSRGAKAVLLEEDIDPDKEDFSEMTGRLQASLKTISMEIAELEPRPVKSIFSSAAGIPLVMRKPIFIGSVLGTTTGLSTLGVPSSFGGVQPVGVGELKLVRQKIKKYQYGEIAHIENVMSGETRSREHRRAQQTEEFSLTEVETEVEEQRELETTDRFELQRETQTTLKTDKSFEAGLKVSGGYGPFIKFEASAKYATKSQKEQSTKFSSELSKEVVSKSLSRLQEKTRTQRSLRLVEEFEERNAHSFENPPDQDHISGVYHWVDKVYEAQIFNYGLRSMFDFVVPEPGTFLIEALRDDPAAEAGLEKPAPFTRKPEEIQEWNYGRYVAEYGASGVEPPPEPTVTVSKQFHAGPDDGNSPTRGSFAASESLVIDDGYEAVYGYATAMFTTWESSAAVDVGIGQRAGRVANGPNWFFYAALDYETGTIPVGVKSFRTATYACLIEVKCRRTAKAMDEWRLKTHQAIREAYERRLSEYEEKLAALAIGEGIAIQGRNPGANEKLITEELKRLSISLLTQQHFELFDAIETGPDGLPRIDFSEAALEGPYIRFFEQAFEWENIAYVFYPYFWGRKETWIDRLNYQEVDTNFLDFITAGAARVVVPTRPGMEPAVAHFLTTGEVWNGDGPPEITDPDYVPIVVELQEKLGAPGDEVPDDTPPWDVIVPTTLVKLRPSDGLPEWEENDEGEWVVQEED